MMSLLTFSEQKRIEKFVTAVVTLLSDNFIHIRTVPKIVFHMNVTVVRNVALK